MTTENVEEEEADSKPLSPPFSATGLLGLLEAHCQSCQGSRGTCLFPFLTLPVSESSGDGSPVLSLSPLSFYTTLASLSQSAELPTPRPQAPGLVFFCPLVPGGGVRFGGVQDVRTLCLSSLETVTYRGNLPSSMKPFSRSPTTLDSRIGKDKGL